MIRLRVSLSAALILGGLTTAATAMGTVLEPDGMAVPVPDSQSKDYYDTTIYNETTLGLQHMLDAWEGAGQINAQTDDSANNVTFSPLCGLEGQMILRGGSCQVDFGWYCTDDAPGSEVIHPLVTAQDIITYHDVTLTTLPGAPPGLNSWTQLQNNDKGFVPTIQSGLLQPVTGAQSLTNVREDPAYLACPSGKIGFAFKGNPTSFCPQSKFSEPSRNQMSSFGSPWISAIVYQSKASPGIYYIAFEDLPTSTASFSPLLTELKATYPTMKQPDGWDGSNDGDFNDFVYQVKGVLCEGGGQPCVPTNPATGQPWQGACSIGVTACSTIPGQPGECQAKVPPTAEVCDGFDNDCNGVADDGPICPEGKICDRGTCIGSCLTGEFPCGPGFECETTGAKAGFCVETACLNVECGPDQRCEAGACLGGCEGRVCPEGTECIAGACVDLCQGVTCPATYVCERGACIPDCKCLPCTDPAKSFCDETGHCVDPACAGVSCPEFQTCKGGSCVDPCEGVDCGAGSPACIATQDGHASCPATTGGGGGNGAAGTPIVVDPSSGNPSTVPGGGTSSGPSTEDLQSTKAAQSCGCRMVGGPSRGALFSLALFGIGLMLRRQKGRA